MERSVENALRVLSLREERVLRICFGLGSAHGGDDVAQHLDMPRAQIQRIQRRALRKLRAAAPQ